MILFNAVIALGAAVCAGGVNNFCVACRVVSVCRVCPSSCPPDVYVCYSGRFVLFADFFHPSTTLLSVCVCVFFFYRYVVISAPRNNLSDSLCLQKEARGSVTLKIVPSYRNPPAQCEVRRHVVLSPRQNRKQLK